MASSGRTIIFGDIHSCAREMFAILDRLEVGPEDTVVAAGDLIDRGPDPWSVYAYFSSGSGRLAIQGNHDRKHVRRLYSPSQTITRLLLGERYDSVRSWMEGLPLWLDLPAARVVHAAYVPGTPMAEQDPAILVGHVSGERKLKGLFPGGEWWERHEGARPVVFGHEVRPEIELKPGLVYALDGGCARGGWLHALVLPEARVVSVKAEANYWAQALASFPPTQYPEVHSLHKLLGATWADLAIILQRDDLHAATRETIVRAKGELEGLAGRVAERASGLALQRLPKGSQGAIVERLLRLMQHGGLTRESVLARTKSPRQLLAAAEALGLEAEASSVRALLRSPAGAPEPGREDPHERWPTSA